ncbi:MAG: Planctomycete cytochrome [Bryobacterales bacterium]|nr:Planctomycete cytochrome [Bryobacterales bacterium]
MKQIRAFSSASAGMPDKRDDRTMRRPVLKIRSKLWLGLCLGACIFSPIIYSQNASNAAGDEAAITLLNGKCATCHGQSRMSELDTRNRESLLKGGSRGPAIVPGKAAESRLFLAIKREGDLKMPPNVTLPAADVEAIRQWIDRGANWPSTVKVVEQPTFWSFRKPVRSAVPQVSDTLWAKNAIDAFVLARMEKEGMRPAPAADRRTLIRRVSFDLTGLPPDATDVDAFVSDQSPDAYSKVVEKYLASPRYGEHWGKAYLDLVRYADTAGFETDHFYPNAWRYRDYVVSAFNTDKPYNEFVQEQIAADEIWSNNMDGDGSTRAPEKKQQDLLRRVGTGLFTVGSFPIEYTYFGEEARAEWQSEAVDVTGAAFLGLTVGCAKCHDHKFDPIRQKDYYSLAAFFAGSEEREIPLVNAFAVQTYNRQMPLIQFAEKLKSSGAGGGRGRGGAAAGRAAAVKPGVAGDQAALPAAAPGADANAEPSADPTRELSAAQMATRAVAMQKLGEAYARLPTKYATATVLAHSDSIPETHIMVRGDWKQKGALTEPATPPFLGTGPAVNEPKDVLVVPQRRKALALWLTSPENPLFARVEVNRIWQALFSYGLVRTPNDFGRQGDAPTHPELLDWLATEFVEKGYSVKQLTRLIMLSNAYQQGSVGDIQNVKKDPENFYLSRMNRRRLNSDSIRDTILATSGNLNLKAGGMSVIVPLNKEEMEAARMPQLWPPEPDPREWFRRSIYLQIKRSLTLPMLAIFDSPDSAVSCARRDVSTVAPQALALMNGDFAVAQADLFAAQVKKEAGDVPDEQVNKAWRRAFGRIPTAREKEIALDYLQKNSLSRLCLFIFNITEFIYVD